MDPPAWSLFRGRNDGEIWAVSHAQMRDLIEWSDISDFEHYMGAIPFPFDNEEAVGLYENAKSDALVAGSDFNHQYYATGFLEAVYEVCQSKFGLDR